jgi:ABC-2 type transport system ATP-binding protein
MANGRADTGRFTRGHESETRIGHPNLSGQLEYLVTSERLGRQFGKYWAVSDLTLSIKQGEVFGMLGPNGAGKTTTMRMLACLVAPSQGSATICGYDIRTNPTEVRKRVGILTESAGLYDALSAQENLQFFAKLYDLPPREVKARAEYYLKLLGLWDRRRDPASTFSSGMRQKLSMARALIHEPSVLLLDEPTSTLDPEGAKLVRDFIFALKEQGRTILLCTHNLAEAQSLCDRVAIIKRSLLRVGTPRQLQTSLYGRQVEFRLALDQSEPLAQEPMQVPNDDKAPRPIKGAAKPQQVILTTVAPTPDKLNDLAVEISHMKGVGDVAASGSSLFVSMDDPDDHTPEIVRYLVNEQVDILRVAEVEHTLERAYLDLVSRPDPGEADSHGMEPEVAA